MLATGAEAGHIVDVVQPPPASIPMPPADLPTGAALAERGGALPPVLGHHGHNPVLGNHGQNEASHEPSMMAAMQGALAGQKRAVDVSVTSVDPAIASGLQAIRDKRAKLNAEEAAFKLTCIRQEKAKLDAEEAAFAALLVAGAQGATGTMMPGVAMMTPEMQQQVQQQVQQQQAAAHQQEMRQRRIDSGAGLPRR